MADKIIDKKSFEDDQIDKSKSIFKNDFDISYIYVFNTKN